MERCCSPAARRGDESRHRRRGAPGCETPSGLRAGPLSSSLSFLAAIGRCAQRQPPCRPKPLESPRYAWVVVAAAFTLMFVGFGAAYSFAAFFTAFEAEFGASRGDIALVFSVAAFLWFSLRRAGRHARRPLRRAPRGPRRGRLPGGRALAGEPRAIARRALRHLQHRHRHRRGPGLRAFGRRGAALVQRRTAHSPPGSPWRASAPATSPGRCSPRGGSSCSAGAAPTLRWRYSFWCWAGSPPRLLKRRSRDTSRSSKAFPWPRR